MRGFCLAQGGHEVGRYAFRCVEWGSHDPRHIDGGPLSMLGAEHTRRPLLEKDVSPDPFEQFQKWLDEALAANLTQPLGMALATATADGKPSNRMVLLRGFDN